MWLMNGLTASAGASLGIVPVAWVVSGTGDFNQDGKVDLAVANRTSAGVVSILLGNGDGSFQPAQAFAAGADPFDVTSADLDADGIADLIVVNNLVAQLAVLRGQGSAGIGDGTFGAPTIYALGTSTSYPAQAVAADLNGDGALDVAVTLYGENKVAVLHGQMSNGQPTGTLSLPVEFEAGTTPWGGGAADLNADGILDIAVADYRGGSFGLLFGGGSGGVPDGTFGAPVAHSAAGALRITIRYFDGDGLNDVGVLCLSLTSSLSSGRGE